MSALASYNELCTLPHCDNSGDFYPRKEILVTCYHMGPFHSLWHMWDGGSTKMCEPIATQVAS